MTATLAAYQAAIMADFKYQEGPNNLTKFGQWYADRVRNQAFATAAWCDMATSYWGSKVGAEDIVGVFAWTPSHAQWFINQNRWSRTPVKGGIAFWDWSGQKSVPGIDHVSALIESVDPNGQAVTIDANYADRVDRWRHPMSNFVGCGLPNWATTNQQEDGLDMWTREQLIDVINYTVINVFRSPEAKGIIKQEAINALNLPVGRQGLGENAGETTPLSVAAWFDAHMDGLNRRISGVDAKADATLAAIAQIANDPDVSLDAIKQAVQEAVANSVQVTGTLEVTSKAVETPVVPEAQEPQS